MSKSLSLLLLFCSLLSGCHSSANEKKIGIIVPLEHKAMNEIVSGFTETLNKKYSHPIKIKIANALGDLNLQRAIIAQMKNEHYDLIIPIGTVTTQMSAAIIKHQPIVSLAAIYSQKEREQRKACNLAIVHDEISTERILEFIHDVYPKLSHLVLVHSSSDKIFPEVAIAKQIGKKMGIEVKAMMVPTLNELYNISKAIPDNTEAILVLKDHLIVSGINTLQMLTEKRHIPLITSDQGSVESGASFSLSVHERDIGVEGAELALSILSGKKACDLPIVEMTKLVVFINQSVLLKENQSLDPIKKSAYKYHYAIEWAGNREGT